MSKINNQRIQHNIWKKDIKKVEISKFEELFNKIFRQELEHNQEKEKIIELFEKNL